MHINAYHSSLVGAGQNIKYIGFLSLPLYPYSSTVFGIGTLIMFIKLY